MFDRDGTGVRDFSRLGELVASEVIVTEGDGDFEGVRDIVKSSVNDLDGELDLVGDVSNDSVTEEVGSLVSVEE